MYRLLKKERERDVEKGEGWGQLTNFNTIDYILFALCIKKFNKIVSLILGSVCIDVYVMLHTFNIFFQLTKDT